MFEVNTTLTWFTLCLSIVFSTIGPGLIVTKISRRWLRLSSDERLLMTVGFSMTLTYLLTMLFFAINAPQWCYWSPVILGLLGVIYGHGEIIRYFATANGRHTVKCFFIFLFFIMLFTFNTLHYSGGFWSGDWFEHYERALYIIREGPKDHLFIATYLFPARPPLMNLIVAMHLENSSTSFEAFQTASAVLNALFIFPLMLFVKKWTTHRYKLVMLILTVVLVLNPMTIQNMLYPWTRMLTALLLLSGLWFYLRAWSKGDCPRLVIAGIFFATSIVCHYSAGPPVLLIAMHYAGYLWWKRGRPIVEPVLTTVISGLLLASWFAWSIINYGLKVTLSSNTSVTDSAQLSFMGNVQKIFGNLISSTVPYFLRGASIQKVELAEPDLVLSVREHMFYVFQTNISGMSGIATVPLIDYLAYKKYHSAKIDRPRKLFWGALMPAWIALGIIVHGTGDTTGVAHVCLQPVALLFIAFMASNVLLLPLWSRLLVFGTWVFDAAFGVFLHLWALAEQTKMMPPVGAEVRYQLERLGLSSLAANIESWQPGFIMLTLFLSSALLVVLGVKVVRTKA